MQGSYNGAVRGDKAVVNGITYLIDKAHEIKGITSAVEYMVYYLEEKK